MDFSSFKSKRKAVIGVTKTTDGTLNVVRKRHISLFVSQLSPNSTCEDVSSFVKKSLKVNEILCEKLQSRHPDHALFKTDLRIDQDTNVLDPENWPDGLLVRRFFHARIPIATKQS